MSTSRSSVQTSWPRAASVAIEGERLHVRLKDGREVTVPIDWFDFLARATDEQRREFRVDEYGSAIWWEGLEEGISVPSLLGLPENPPRVRQDRYAIDYRHDGRRWIAEVADLESWTWAPTLSGAKRAGRELLSTLLQVQDLSAAGIDVVDEVHTAESTTA